MVVGGWSSGVSVGADRPDCKASLFFLQEKEAGVEDVCLPQLSLIYRVFFLFFFIRGFSDYIHTDGSRCFHQT